VVWGVYLVEKENLHVREEKTSRITKNLRFPKEKKKILLARKREKPQ